MKLQKLMKYKRRIPGIVLGVVLSVSTLAWGALPTLINFQGKLLDTNKNPQNGSFVMTFRICDSESGDCSTSVWEETQGSVSVTNGVFAVQLGDSTPVTESVFDSDTRYLEIIVDGETLSPRERLITTPYAFKAGTADQLATTNVDYVRNQNTLQSGASFYVTSGQVETNLTVDGAIIAGSGSNQITTAAGLLDSTQLTSPIPNSIMDNSSVTKQGNSFNGANQLVQLNGSSGLDLSGSLSFSGVATDITTAAGEDLVLSPNGGVVGVGLTSPIAQLHVSSANAAATDNVFMVSSGTAAGQEMVTVKGDGFVEVAQSVRNGNFVIQVYDNTGGLTFSDGTWLAIDWDSQTIVDPIFSHDPGGANPSRITVNRTGLYKVLYNVNSTYASGTRSGSQIRVTVNGTQVTPSQTASYNRSSVDRATCTGTVYVNVTSGQYIEIEGSRPGSSGSVTTTGGGEASWVIVEFIR